MDDWGYTYFYYELFDQIGLTTITLHVKSPHIQMHENVFQKELYVRVEFFELRLGLKGGLKKNTCQLFL
jgi:hypothetical protein